MSVNSFTPQGGILYVVPTPIGNLGDITYRALEVLKQAQLIVAEDTRTLRHLLDKYDIAPPVTLSYREQVHRKVYPKIKDWLTRRQIVALTTDAGTPGISDPGTILISELQRDGYKVEVLPGANAVTTALVQSGLPTDHFMFLGFLPRKHGKLAQLLTTSYQLHTQLPTTFIAYESSHRITESLETIWQTYEHMVSHLIKETQNKKAHLKGPELDVDPQTAKLLHKLKQEAQQEQRPKVDDTHGLQIRVARELTKQFGEVTGVDLTFDLSTSRKRFQQWLNDLPIKGEFVVLLRWQAGLQNFAITNQD